jgi:cation transport protein ChaC
MSFERAVPSMPAPLAEPPALPVLRDPAPLLEAARAEVHAGRELWVFGYGSLICRPEFQAVETRRAMVHGYHRALRMRSRVNRGTPERPGLVFALMRGGSCQGMVFRIAHTDAEKALQDLWVREMPTGVYDPRWLPCRTPNGAVHALAFTLSHESPAFTGILDDPSVLEILRHACGRYGTTLDYLVETANGLVGCGIRDREVERLVALARHHGLLAD